MKKDPDVSALLNLALNILDRQAARPDADRAKRTAPARAEQASRLRKRLCEQVDPDGTMDPHQRDRLVVEATSAFYRDLASKSVAARRTRRTTS